MAKQKYVCDCGNKIILDQKELPFFLKCSQCGQTMSRKNSFSINPNNDEDMQRASQAVDLMKYGGLFTTPGKRVH